MSDLIHWIFDMLMQLGWAGIMLGLMIEVIPSEIVLAYGGFMIAGGHLSFPAALIAAIIGGLFSQLFLYWAGYYGGRPFLLKYGKYVFIKEKQIVMAEKWFEKYGTIVIFTARFIPIVRHAISIPAGIVKMPAWKFSLYTVLAIIPWSIGFLLLGEKLGSNWENVKEFVAPYIPYGIGGAVLICGALIWFQSKKDKKTAVQK